MKAHELGRLATSLAASLLFHVVCCSALNNAATFSFVSGWPLHASLSVVKSEWEADGKVPSTKFLDSTLSLSGGAIIDQHGKGVELGPAIRTDQASPDAVKYVPVGKLDKRPFPLTDLEVPDLHDVDIESVKGRLVLRVWIDSLGNVEHLEQLEATGMGQASQAIVEGYKKMRFSPGEVNGRAVGCVLLIEVMLEEALLGGGQ